MHYYKRNLGDYHKKAGRLSMMEHGAYTLLLDACYDREEFPTLNDAIDWCWARNDAEIEAVKFVLRKFFELQDDGRYIQPRIAEEIAAYRAMAERNAQIARDRECKKTVRAKNSTTNQPVVNEACTRCEKNTTTNQPVVPKTQPNHKPVSITSTSPACAREDDGNAYPMSADWQPNESIAASLRMAGLPDLVDEVCQTGLVEFRAYWQTRPKDCMTGAQWTHKFLQSLMSDKTRGRYRPPIRDKPAGKMPKQTNFSAVDYGNGGKL